MCGVRLTLVYSGLAMWDFVGNTGFEGWLMDGQWLGQRYSVNKQALLIGGDSDVGPTLLAKHWTPFQMRSGPMSSANHMPTVTKALAQRRFMRD